METELFVDCVYQCVLYDSGVDLFSSITTIPPAGILLLLFMYTSFLCVIPVYDGIWPLIYVRTCEFSVMSSNSTLEIVFACRLSHVRAAFVMTIRNGRK